MTEEEILPERWDMRPLPADYNAGLAEVGGSGAVPVGPVLDAFFIVTVKYKSHTEKYSEE